MYKKCLNYILSQKHQNILFRLWVISSQQKLLAFAACFSLIISSSISVLFPYNIGKFTHVFSNEEEFLKLSSKMKSLLGFLLLYGIISMGTRISIEMFSMGFIKEMRKTYFKSLMEKDIEFFDSKTSSDLFSLLTGEIENLKNTSIIEVASIIKHVVETLGAFIGMFYVSFRLSMLLILLIPVIGIILNISNGHRRKQFHDIHSHKKASHHIALESLENIRIVKAFSTEEKELKKYENKLNEMAAIENNTLIKTTLIDFCLGALFVAGVMGIIRIGIYLLTHQSIGISNLTSFLLYCYMVFSSFMKLSQMSRRIVKSLYIAEKLFDVIDYVPKIKPSKTGLQPVIKGEIKLNSIDFDYPLKKGATVLKNFSLAINKNESVGIVGSSGSGKTTLINLILRLYEINSSDNPKNTITIDGVNLKEIQLKFFHQKIGYVCQEPALFNGTILDNIVYGVDAYSMQDVELAIKRAKADFIFKEDMFPMGLKTNVGERGVQLSGGQKQRIAIARALIKKPSILILDEATSALDSESEFQFQTELNELKGTMTIIIVAHRLSTIKNCDKIVVLHHGEIVESGKHEELMALDGRYKKLMKKQAGDMD